jgi:hypothetical protein
MSKGGDFVVLAYGVAVRVRGNDQSLLEAARVELQVAFAGNAKFFDSLESEAEHTYSVVRDKNGQMVLFLNGRKITSGGEIKRFLRYFNSLVRLTVAEHATGRVFVHAGVVGWNGQTIVMPARSFQGKSTLVAELVRLGAHYYSDEYAVIDESGLVHAFPRPITMRTGSAKMEIKDLEPTWLGVVSNEPAPIGGVLFTEFRPNARWRPVRVSLGQGILAAVEHTIPFSRKPGDSLKVLNTALNRAIIVKSPRGDAGKFARIILDFFDNCN